MKSPVSVALVTCILFVAGLLFFVQAAELGAQRATSSVSTNSATALPPIGDTGRFDPEVMYLDGPAGVTAAVYWVSSGYTGTVSAATAVDSAMLSLTSVPSMFFGDSFLVVANTSTSYPTLGTNLISATVVGSVFD